MEIKGNCIVEMHRTICCPFFLGQHMYCNRYLMKIEQMKSCPYLDELHQERLSGADRTIKDAKGILRS